MNPPTPWPPDMATGENPPDGAMIDYYIGPKFSGALTLEIRDSKRELVAKVNSSDPVPPLDPRYPDPVLWARPPRVLSVEVGHHRFLWDLRSPALPGNVDRTVSGRGDTVQHACGSVVAVVLPGMYTVHLMTGGGKASSEHLRVVMNPRGNARSRIGGAIQSIKGDL